MQILSRIFSCSLVLTLLLISQAFAQSPEAFKYQAVVRDANNAPLAWQTVKVRISILQIDVNGPVVYQEVHDATTSALGLISLNIGEGGVLSGVFADIDWGLYQHFLQIEIDETGGTNYYVLGTSQLLSVPYALFAKEAETALNVDDADADPANEIQTLSLDGDALSISLGDTVILPTLTAGEGIEIVNQEIINAKPGLWELDSSIVFVDTNQVGIGLHDSIDFPEDTRLFVNGNVRVADASKLSGVIRVEGPKDTIMALRIIADPSRAEDIRIAPSGRVFFAEEVGINQLNEAIDLNVRNQDGNSIVFNVEDTIGTDLFRVERNGSVGVNQLLNFVDLNVRNRAGNSTVFQLENETGGDIFEVGRTGNVGVNQITNNVTLQVQNRDTTGGVTNNIIANFEKADGSNVLQIQADNDVVVTGDFSVNNGNKNFVLDHPLDPANKALYHNAVESPDHVTYYHGTVTLGADGSATVSLPDYFEALNADFHYQLTCVGAFAQVFVAQEINDNKFVIDGGQAGMKVSWQVSARRNDPWAHDHPYEAEIEKDSSEKGRYYYPEGYGKGRNLQIGASVINGEDR